MSTLPDDEKRLVRYTRNMGRPNLLRFVAQTREIELERTKKNTDAVKIFNIPYVSIVRV